jgi:hypothetical protein
MSATVLKSWGRLPAEYESLVIEIKPEPPKPPRPRPEPKPDPVDLMRRLVGDAPGHDLASKIGAKLDDRKSINRFRQVLAMGQSDPALMAEIAASFKACLKDPSPRKSFGHALSALVPARKSATR